MPELVTDESRAVAFQLARAAAFLNARRRSQAAALAREALTTAQRLQRPDLQARALLLIARSATWAADPAETIEVLHEVVLLARAAEDPRTEAEAYIEMISRVTDRRLSPSDDASAAELEVLAKLAPSWAKMARSLLGEGDDGRLELELDYRLAELFREQAAFDSARDRLAHAEKLAAVHAAHGSPIHAHLEAALGRVEAGAGKMAHAEKLFRGAKKKYARMLGEDHPNTIEANYWIAAVAEDGAEARKLATEVYAKSLANRRVDADSLVRAAEAVELIRHKGWIDEEFGAQLEAVLEASGAERAKALAAATRRAAQRQGAKASASADAVVVISEGVTLRVDESGATVSVDAEKANWAGCTTGEECKRKTWKWTAKRPARPKVPKVPTVPKVPDVAKAQVARPAKPPRPPSPK